MSVVGIDNIEMSAHIFPPLTSVHLPVARTGEVAANCLLDELAGRGVKSMIEPPIELCITKIKRKGQLKMTGHLWRPMRLGPETLQSKGRRRVT